MAGKDRKRLRSGFTTGTAAAAAARAALELIFSGRTPEKVSVALPTGDDLRVAVHRCRGIDAQTAVCSVIKDAGDDPDITHGAEIGARVKWRKTHRDAEVIVRGGQGVGMVTKPGLEVPPGRHAINPGPLKMIRRAALDAMTEYSRRGTAEVEILVPQGRELARKTLNARLGILGGISILGTTGIVRPMSHEAYTATIRSALSVARAAGLHRVVLTTGRRSERFARSQWPQLPEEAFVQIGDYFCRSMEMAASKGFTAVVLAVFFGKAVKMAQGAAHTHAGSARMSLEQLSRWAMQITGDSHLAGRIDKANTARHAFEMLKDDYPEVINKVGREVVRRAASFGGGRVKVGAVIFGFDGMVRFASTIS
jgi:cobalt-precorrin-5B (C1)-methyltransferase